MNFLAKIFGAGAGDLVESVGSVVDKFVTTDAEKQQLGIELERVMTERLSVMKDEVVSRFNMVYQIIQAEMASGDNYTKRARPTLVYFGMAMIFINYVLVPACQSLSGAVIAPFDLPTEFWAAWGGTVGLWTIGRSIEKSGTTNRATSALTGSKRIERLLDN